jgi:DNA-directed RNA polymerase subunit H (RpoH/RPB5)
LEVFEYNQLLVHPGEHSHMPPYRWLNREEISAISAELKQKGIKNGVSAFQVILTSDPLAKFYGRNPGDVLEILMEEPVSGSLIPFYRIVRGERK